MKNPPGKTAWRVNGRLIRAAEIRAEAAFIRQGQELTVEDRLRLPEVALERLVEREILRSAAQRMGFLPTEAEVQQALAQMAPRNDGVVGCRAGIASEENVEDIRQRLAVDRLMDATLAKAKRPQAWQVSEFYRKNADYFWTPELAHVWHLVKGSGEAAQVLRERVAHGEAFAEVAKDSDCPEYGGDLGYFARGKMVEEFDDVVFAAPIGELTPVFSTRFGFHTAIVKDRKPPGIRALDEVRPQIEAILLRQAQDAVCGDLLAKLHKSAKIEQVTE